MITTDTFFDAVVSALKESGRYPSILDYGKVSSGSEGIPIKTPHFQVESILDYGGSEGIYLDIALRFPEKGGWTTVQLAVFKTLDAGDNAMRTMGVLLADFTCEVRRYVDAHYDDLDRSGFSVRGIKSDGSVTQYRYLADSMEKAKARTREFRPCEEIVKAIILNKETGEETVVEGLGKTSYRIEFETEFFSMFGRDSADSSVVFDDADEVCQYLECNKIAEAQDIDSIREKDRLMLSGCISNTPWWKIYKGGGDAGERDQSEPRSSSVA